ncbi:aldehyde dehydrogenase family protein [Agarilytica rhodophyticola]|uniref:aldehyde dehydrogenase family protein n=1 Tax=Agarilytica rhodophyticola TaxID=1737490 RepID=UPI000B3480D0|nr:aldehyde dehydrogenase family protein [Agarilytica rhodophyticola]
MTDSSTLDVINPSTGETIASINTDSKESALLKLDRAWQLHKDSTRHLPLHTRISLLEKLAAHLVSRREDFISTMVKEGGKPWRDSQVEFDRAVHGIQLAISTVAKHTGSSIPLGYQLSSANRMANTQVFPIGVVLAFSAFNHPLNLIIHQIIPAFATGCPCLVKPASDTPMSCKLLVESMHEVGIPLDYIQAVVPANLDIAGELVTSEKIAFFSFIGSARVGWMLRSQLKPGVRCALEHGGIAPAIVSQNADLDSAVTAIAKGGFYHAGQVCVSTQRIYVHASVLDTFITKLKEKAATLKVGDALEPETDVGPLIRSSEVTRIHSWVQEAINEGAECVLGGEVIDEHYYQPTILVNPATDAKVSNQEIFGPVVCLYSYDTLDEAIAACNHEKFAFQASIFSENLGEVTQAYNGIEASAVMVNDHTAFRDDVMPFAGLKHSGLGVGGIPYTIHDMQYEKMLVLK